MSKTSKGGLSRRDVLKTTGQAAAVGALAGVALPQVHAGEDNTIRVALVGCGGRGTGAASNALASRNGPTRLVAMADVFQDRLNSSYNHLQRSRHARQVDVPEARRFIGFDAYRRALDCLRRGDIAIFATPPAFRWVHFGYAIERGLNVFMEKPVTVDGPSTRKLFDLAGRAERANLKVGVGLMCRHCDARKELHDRIRQGEIGDILLMRAYRVTGPTGTAFVAPKPNNISELHYQIRNFHGFLWASGGCFSDFLIHNIDECCWMKNAFPVSAKGYGGRHYRGNFIDQNFDSYTVEYTFADGTKLMLEGRNMPGCANEFASYAHGTRAAAVISTEGHTPALCRIYRGQNIGRAPRAGRPDASIAWMSRQPEPDPYQLEWDHLLDAIRRDQRYNEARRGAEASLVTSMGRMACHTGQVITRDRMLACEQEFAPTVDRLTLDGPAPLRANGQGKYAVPQPGIVTDREY